jgi:hypothetical protein
LSRDSENPIIVKLVAPVFGAFRETTELGPAALWLIALESDRESLPIVSAIEPRLLHADDPTPADNFETREESDLQTLNCPPLPEIRPFGDEDPDLPPRRTAKIVTIADPDVGWLATKFALTTWLLNVSRELRLPALDPKTVTITSEESKTDAATWDLADTDVSLVQ